MAVLELQRQLVEVRGRLEELEGKHERLRGAFYQARQGLAANGDAIVPLARGNRPKAVSRGESREEFKARMLGARAAPQPTDEGEG